jgi:hypothetical protein
MQDDLERAPDREAAIDRDARLAADPDAAIPARVAALVRVVEGTSLLGTVIPPVIAEAIDDGALVDAALATRRAGAVIAAVVLLGPDPALVSSRRRVVRRLVAAGETGIALAGLAITIGDVSAGVALVVRDYREAIVPRLGAWRFTPRQPASDPVIGAWLGLVAEQPDPAATAIVRALADAGASLEVLFVHAPDRVRGDRLDHLRRALTAS